MDILDDINEMKKIDKENVYGSIVGLTDQCNHAWEDTLDINVPDNYKNINAIVMTGMGGSGLGARIIESVYSSNLKLPLFRVNDYDLPAWVDNKTLVICSSFSGTTEETVENIKQAQQKGCKLMAIGSGGTLIKLAEQIKVPFYKINPTYNPSKQPRLAIGYQVIGQLSMVSKTGLIKFSDKNIKNSISAMKKVLDVNNREISMEQNQAKKLAKEVFNKCIIFVGSRHMIGAIHTVKNQTNENAKHFTAIFDIPELNHHLMEGLRFPENNNKHICFIFIKSGLYPERIKKRFEITEEIVKKYLITALNWKAQSNDPLAQAFEFIQFGGLVNYYLVMLHGIDPAPIPWVDFFKVRLGQSLGQWK